MSRGCIFDIKEMTVHDGLMDSNRNFKVDPKTVSDTFLKDIKPLHRKEQLQNICIICIIKTGIRYHFGSYYDN